MKIIIAHYKYYVQGGPERYMFKFMELAQKNGHEVIPFSVNYPTNAETEYSKFFVGDKDAGGNYDSSNHSISYLVKNVYHEFHNKQAYKNLRKLIKETKADLLYCLIPGQLTTDIFKAAHDEGIKVILRISDFRLICGKYSMVRDGNVCEECLNGHYKSCVKHRCVKNSRILSRLRAMSLRYNRKHNKYKYVDAVITPPEFTKQLLIKDGIFKDNQIFVNPTFVDCSKIDPCYEHDNYVLCLGRFAPEKGFQYAIESMKYLKDFNIKLVITGDKDTSDKMLIQIINDNDLEDKVCFVGFKKGQELEDLIKKSMAIIAPAVWYENMPNAVLEAYSYGKPVIASNIGSLAEIVKDGETGYLFTPKNSEELAEKIKLLFNENYTDICKNARKKCVLNYSPQKHLEEFLKIYWSLKK